MKIGTFYRALVTDYLGIAPRDDRILDVGASDGYWLSRFTCRLQVGLDLVPSKAPNVVMVKADGCTLPFKQGVFNEIFSFEVIEHVDDAKRFLESLVHATDPKGSVVLSTPHKSLRIWPAFSTAWVHKRWGHVREGYDEDGIKRILDRTSPPTSVRCICWPGRYYVRFYFPLRLLWGISKGLAEKVVRRIAMLDSQYVGQKQSTIYLLFMYITKGVCTAPWTSAM